MAENNIVICENCYQENDLENNTCKECGARLYKNKYEKETDTTLLQENHSNQIIEEPNMKNNINNYEINTVARMIKRISIFLMVLSFISGLAVLLFSSLFVGITILISSVFTCIFIYAFGEVIQLLEDIKNKK